MPDSAQEGKTEDACQHNFSDCSGPFAARVCSLQAGRSLSGFVPSVQERQSRNPYAAEQPSPPSSLLCGAYQTWDSLRG